MYPGQNRAASAERAGALDGETARANLISRSDFHEQLMPTTTSAYSTMITIQSEETLYRTAEIFAVGLTSLNCDVPTDAATLGDRLTRF
ncbi:MAG: hypothetical protein ACI8PT_003195 [Gammaproteobacteria bacterium]|jgi:hypothetical protein